MSPVDWGLQALINIHVNSTAEIIYAVLVNSLK